MKVLRRAYEALKKALKKALSALDSYLASKEVDVKTEYGAVLFRKPLHEVLARKAAAITLMAIAAAFSSQPFMNSAMAQPMSATLHHMSDEIRRW